MFKKRFFSGLMGGIFSVTLLLNCVAKSTPDTKQLPDQTEVQAESIKKSISTIKATTTKLQSMEEAIATIDSVISNADLEKKVISGLQKKITSKPANTFDEVELQAFVNLVLNTYGPDLSRDGRTALRTVLSFLSKKLSAYKVSGVAFACDPNIALIGDTQNPSFTAVFKDAQGKIKSRIFDALITSWGIKIAFSINLDLIFFTGDINFEDSNKVLELGTGIDITQNFFRFIPGGSPLLKECIPPLTFLYAPFKNSPGGIVMVGTALGFAGGISVVTSGKLTPRIN